jgi:hypothetical protein
MKVSKRRLETALQVRDTACRILTRIGTVTTIDNARGNRYRCREVRIGDLLILWSRPSDEQMIDIWTGRKVFSISWPHSGRPHVVAFRPGSWLGLLFSADFEPEWGVPSSILSDGSSEPLPALGKLSKPLKPVASRRTEYQLSGGCSCRRVVAPDQSRVASRPVRPAPASRQARAELDCRGLSSLRSLEDRPKAASRLCFA